MPHFPFILMLCLTCERPAEPGFHFCADHLALPWEQPQVVRVTRELDDAPAPVPVHLVECHPSDAALMDSAGYRLLHTDWDPATYQPVRQLWVPCDDGDE